MHYKILKIDADVCQWGFAPRGEVQVLMEMTTLTSALVAAVSKLPADHSHVFISSRDEIAREISGGKTVRKRLKTVI